MSDNMWVVIYSILVLAAIVAARLLSVGLGRTKSRKVRFGMALGLFFLYTMGLLFVLYSVYDDMPGKNLKLEEYHRMVMLAILGYNAAIFFMGCISFVRNGKHRLSDAEKMKLQDM